MTKIIITPLGTVSPYPKGQMNCPGFFVEYAKEKILLDCGNGITRLLNFPKDLENLKVIITHYHKDHLADLGSIQYASFVYHNLGLLKEKIKIYLPEEDYANNKKAILANKESYADYFNINDNLAITLNDLNIAFEDNKSHTINSYMVKLQNKDFKIVYTSDIGTTNWEKLVDFCQNASLIICESSFLKKHHSNSTSHLTAYEAGLLAKEAKVQKLLLTHLWPEEDKSLYLEEAKQVFPNTYLAQEGKNLSSKNIKLSLIIGLIFTCWFTWISHLY